MSAFGRMVKKIEGKGYRAVSATKIAAAIGRRKLGSAEMARRAAASRKRHEAEGK